MRVIEFLDSAKSLRSKNNSKTRNVREIPEKLTKESIISKEVHHVVVVRHSETTKESAVSAHVFNTRISSAILKLNYSRNMELSFLLFNKLKFKR